MAKKNVLSALAAAGPSAGPGPHKLNLYRVDITARLDYDKAGTCFHQFSIPVFASNLEQALQTARQNLSHVKLRDIDECRALLLLKQVM